MELQIENKQLDKLDPVRLRRHVVRYLQENEPDQYAEDVVLRLNVFLGRDVEDLKREILDEARTTGVS